MKKLGKRGKKNRGRYGQFAILISVCIALLFVSGQQGCEMPGFPGGKQAEKTGLGFSLVSGIDYLTAGKTLSLGETFFVGIEVKNYDKQIRTGNICIRDTITDTFGGISSQGNGECKSFSIKAAEVMKKEAGGFFGKAAEQLNPGTTIVYFPQTGEYTYHNMPSMPKPYPGELFVSLRYSEITKASGAVSVSDTKQPAITQDPAPVSIMVTKSAHKMQDAYKLNLDILLRKQQGAKIFSSDFSKENVVSFNAELESTPYTLECKTPDGKPAIGLIDFENERLIKCSSLIYLAGKEESYPLIITLNYGAALEKTYPFSIKTEEL